MATFSSAVKGLNTEVIWYERASPRRTRRSMGMRVTSTPSSSTRPPSGRSSPLNWPISVVLPAPLGPITACSSPGRTSSDRSSVTVRPP